MNRPPLSAWMLADILAINAGWRYELASTLWPSMTRGTRAASQVSCVHGSIR